MSTGEPISPPLPGFMPANSSTPDSAQDKAFRRAAGLASFVLPLRFAGVFLPARLLRRRGVLEGLLVSTEKRPREFACAVHPMDGDSSPLSRVLVGARMVKRRENGALLLGGMEWDEGYLRQWPQTWLCGPSQAVITASINDLSPWLSAHYTGRG